jgi:hypothetical protein
MSTADGARPLRGARARPRRGARVLTPARRFEYLDHKKIEVSSSWVTILSE